MYLSTSVPIPPAPQARSPSSEPTYLNNNISTAPAKFLPLRSLDPAFFTINTIYQQFIRSATAFEPALPHRQFFDTFILPLFPRDYIDNAWWKGKILWRKELWRQDERY
jgi:hypothetical protein